MYECPNCGGNLKFDITLQMLKCDYCLTTQNPYEVTKDKDAEESAPFDVTIFTCPQCGGEILSTDTSAAEFCSFCGASTILDSRISKEKRPVKIIPFKQTKEACKKAYTDRLKRAIFAPDELKDEKYIDSFRGIYMPYWTYHITQQGGVEMKGKKTFRKGDYVYTDHYELGGDLDAYYKELSYDASASFADNISERIAPFNVKDMQPFTPSYLSGFYADTADVDSSLYEEDAKTVANTASFSRIKKDAAFSGIQFTSKENNSSAGFMLHTYLAPVERVMFPVWFMSYRKGDRIAYATVNGQTGKVAADIPVDIKKYVTGSLILAVPIFILLNLFFTIKATYSLIISAILAAATLILYGLEMNKISRWENREEDRGYHLRKKRTSSKKSNNQSGISGFIGSLLAVVIAVCILVFSPISDIWYYGGSIAAFIGILFTTTSLIKKYNILATRKLPQFDRKGGNDHA
ncbi:MAG: hypothetical protein HDR71_15245 [Lachnospiraceae bacterium]|nr:hypothetical protein [Lachnospiraceae bacterium]